MAEQKRYNRNNRGNYNKNRNNNYNRNNSNRNRNNNQNRRSQNQDQNRNHSPKNQQAPPKENASKPSTAVQSKTESSNDLIIFVVFLIAVASFFLVRKFYFPPEKNALYADFTNKKFMKEGKLAFRDAQSNEVIMEIAIEVAQSNYEIEQGLMHRRSLPANGGMLFLFPDANYRTFWMKDTYLSLDIIFLDEKKEIIRICKKAAPLSEVSIPSGGKAQYVVEVLAGFTDTYQIHLGDRIDFHF